MSQLRPGLAVTLIAALIAVFLLMPLIAVIPVSFTPNRYLSVPDAEWSLRHYRTLIEKPEWAQGVWLSIRVGVVASLFATTLATAFALGFFVTPAILGGGRSVMVAELIYLRIFQSPDWGLGAAISVILMVTVGALLALMMRQAGGRAK